QFSASSVIMWRQRTCFSCFTRFAMENAPTIAAAPPHPLDTAFEKGHSDRDFIEGLSHNALYKKALKEAVSAKKQREEDFRKNPHLMAPSPPQAARLRFLEVLNQKKPDA